MNPVSFSFLGFVCFFSSSPLLALSSGLSFSSPFVDSLSSHGIDVDASHYGSSSAVLGWGVDGNRLLLYWMNKADAPVPQVLLASPSHDVSDYSVLPLSVWNSGSVRGVSYFAFDVSSSFRSDSSFSLFVNSLRYSYGKEDEVDYPVGVEYSYDPASSSFSSVSYPVVDVSDKLVSYWNVAEGVGHVFSASGKRVYTEHYVAFNFPVEIDSILSVDIISSWKYIKGSTDLTASASVISPFPYLQEGDQTLVTYDLPSDPGPKDPKSQLLGSLVSSGDYSRLGLSSFSSPLVSYSDRSHPETYHVDPKDVTKTTYDSFFWFKFGYTQYRWNTIEDLSAVGKSGTFRDRFEAIFGDRAYSKVSSELWGDGLSPRYRWFINFFETPVYPDFYHHFDGHECFVDDNSVAGGLGMDVSDPLETNIPYQVRFGSRPFQIAEDASLVRISYRSQGKTYDSFVVDRAQDSTPDPLVPFVPDRKPDGGKWDFVFLVVVLAIFFVIVGLLCFFFPVVLKALSAVFKAFVFVLKLFFVCCWLPVWIFVALFCKASGRSVPQLWFWR